MTTGEITTALKNCGIIVTRKTLYDDIETLNRYGFEILCDKSRSNRYYVADRKFERPEVQILLQVIGGAKFLSKKKSTHLSRKVAELLGEAQAEELISTISENQSKSQNEQIYYNIDAITTALLKRKKLSFLYFDTDIYGKKSYRKNKERYEVNPIGLIYSGDYFYLVCYHDKYKEPTNYRIDRMESVDMGEQTLHIAHNLNILTSMPIAEKFFLCMQERKRKLNCFSRKNYQKLQETALVRTVMW